jgi:hypothetical protein
MGTRSVAYTYISKRDVVPISAALLWILLRLLWILLRLL